jgi:hypothetical protein
MKDFYSALNLSPDADPQAITGALANAPADVRADAQSILLDARRRLVYDRNHRLLSTIGELRSHLGLSYTRFWARKEYKDFWKELSSAPAQRGKRVDAVLIAGAFRAVGKHGRKHVTHSRNWIIAGVLACAVLLAFVAYRLAR